MKNIERKDILSLLKEVIIPNVNRSLLEVSWLKDFRLEDQNLHIEINIPADQTSIKEQLTFEIISKVTEKYPTLEVHPHYVTNMLQDQSPQLNNPVSQIKNIIAVGSGKGGVGKSTVSLNLALALKEQGAKVGILDADLYGPSLPTMLGVQGQRPAVEVVDGKHKLIPLEKYGLYALSLGMVVDPEQAVVLRGPRLAGIIKQFFNECSWPDLDYLIVDLPPGTGDIQLTLVQTVPITGAVLVTTPQEVAVVDAVKAMNMFLLEQIQVPVLGVVENMSWFTPEDMPNKKYYLFGEGGGKSLAKRGKTRLLGQIPMVQGIRKGSDSGHPIMTQEAHPAQDAFKTVAKGLLEQVVLRNTTIDPTKVVNIQ